jgi:hypothetical protein
MHASFGAQPHCGATRVHGDSAHIGPLLVLLAATVDVMSPEDADVDEVVVMSPEDADVDEVVVMSPEDADVDEVIVMSPEEADVVDDVDTSGFPPPPLVESLVDLDTNPCSPVEELAWPEASPPPRPPGPA